MDAVIQWIGTSWTTRSRGGPAATARNAAAVGFRLPHTAAPRLHRIRMREQEDFEPRFEPDAEPGDLRADVAECRLEPDGRLRFKAIASPYGAPGRARRPPAVRLARGEWLRWQINYRFGGRYDWTYRLDTFNVANGPVAPDRFLGTPDHFVDERALLR